MKNEDCLKMKLRHWRRNAYCSYNKLVAEQASKTFYQAGTPFIQSFLDQEMYVIPS